MSRLIDKCNRVVRAGLFALGAESMLYKLKTSGDLVLMFHNVLEVSRPDLNMRNIGVKDFDVIIAYLVKHFDVVSLREILTKPSAGRRIAITFDDGLINNLRYALPILEKYKTHAAIFVSTSWLEGRASLWPDDLNRITRKYHGALVIDDKSYRKRYQNSFANDASGERLENALQAKGIGQLDDCIHSLEKTCQHYLSSANDPESEWRVMNGEELKIIAKSPFVELGSHGVTHVNLNFATDDVLEAELQDSKSYLEQITGKPCDMFAFPFGAYDKRVLEATERAGYTCAIAVSDFNTTNASKLQMCFRYGVYNDISTVETLHRINQFFV